MGSIMQKAFATLLLSLAAASSAQALPLYLPSGPQTNVALTTVTSGGWTQCYAATFNVSIGNQAQDVLSQCNGDYLMMAGRVTGSSDFLVLAAADRNDTIINTGQSNGTHLSNGSNWWFANNWSWGFTAAGDTVTNSQCDTSNSPTSLCLHTIGGVGGYRINNIVGLNNSPDYEKVFFVANAQAVGNVPEPASVALLGLGLLAFAASRKRRS
jgi:hypothetical protein